MKHIAAITILLVIGLAQGDDKRAEEILMNLKYESADVVSAVQELSKSKNWKAFARVAKRYEKNALKTLEDPAAKDDFVVRNIIRVEDLNRYWLCVSRLVASKEAWAEIPFDMVPGIVRLAEVRIRLVRKDTSLWDFLVTRNEKVVREKLVPLLKKKRDETTSAKDEDFLNGLIKKLDR